MKKEKVIETLEVLIQISKAMNVKNIQTNDVEASSFENGQISAYKTALSMIKKMK